MSTKIPGGGPRRPDTIQKPADAAPAQQVEAKPAARAAPEAELPEKYPGLSAQPSALSNVIEAGLSSLAKANGWEATDNALGVLVKAMVGASAKAPEGPQTSATLPMEFSRLLKEFVPPGDAAALAQLKKDAGQLVKLAVVALGTEGIESLPKAKQAAQLDTDVRAIQGALADVLALPTEQRREVLGASDRMLSWKANVLDRNQDALQAAGVDSPARLDALAGILRIVSRYANAAA